MATAYYTNLQIITGGNVQPGGFSNIEVSETQNANGSYSIYTDAGRLFGTFAGYTPAGDPVFHNSNNTSLFLLTNSPLQAGSAAPAYAPASRFVACFLRGTMIATPRGDQAIDALAPGDKVLTSDGREIAIKWIGRQTVSTLFGGSDERAPICVSAGALGANRPVRDLKLTADHALLIDGVLVQAGALVNGVTIRRMTQAETGAVYTVWHIETEGHQVILAEGCAAETFVDNVGRQRFDNYAEYMDLYGEEGAAIPEIDLPRVKSARQLPRSLRDLIAVPRAA